MELRAGGAVLTGAEQLAPVDFTSALKNAAKAKVLDSGGACMPLHDERGFFSLTLACSIPQPHLYTVSFALERPMINDANGFGY